MMTAVRPTLLLFLAFAAVCAAQVPVTKDPSHRVVFEHPQLRVMSVEIAPGATTVEHRHEFDVATISMNAGTPTRVQTSGKPSPETRPPRPLGDAAITEYAGTPGAHRIENTGKLSYQLFAVENLKKSGWSTAAATSGQGTKVLKETRAFRMYDVKLAVNSSQASHTHTAPTIAVLVSGKVMSDGPDAQAKAWAPAAVGLRQLDAPGQWLLIPAGDRHHLVRLGTTDAHVVEIEVR